MYLKVNNSVDPNQTSFVNWGNSGNAGYGMLTLAANIALTSGDVTEAWINTTTGSGIIYTAAGVSTPHVPSVRIVVSRIGN